MELHRAAREYYQVAVAFLDVDRCKLINDRWGHAVGDDALQKVSDHIQAQMRMGDAEFMLAFVRTDAQSAERTLERLRETLRTVSVGPAAERFTSSAGISESTRHGPDLPELSKLADHTLYWAREHGRDQWTICSPATGGGSLVQTLLALARSIDAKNRFTGGHSERVAAYAVKLAESLGFEPDRVADIRQAALLHDIGKIGVKESVLLKEEPPNLEDQDELQRHSALGCAMLAGAGAPEIGRWILHLHERFDGRGYPEGLAGRQIPVESRILHAADALDQMTRPHVYRRHRPLREALAELAFGAGTRLDPELSQRLIKLVQSGDLRIPGHQTVGRPVRQPARRMRGAAMR